MARIAATMLLIAVMVTGATGIAGASESGTPEWSLPAKVLVDEELRQEIEELVPLSPTLRRQLAVIAAAPVRVEVRVSAVPALVMPGMSRAETTIGRYESGYIKAVVVIPAGLDFVELLAHELEHVVEQIEGVDLEALARTREASRNAGGVFETIRARDAGLAAADEVEKAVRALRAGH
jgi:hypothetical protein